MALRVHTRGWVEEPNAKRCLFQPQVLLVLWSILSANFLLMLSCLANPKPCVLCASAWTKIAAANVPVLIHGESGTGKDIIARMIHAAFAVEERPLGEGELPRDSRHPAESELFGYEKGAFTGAYGMKPGRVEMAHRGTLVSG